VCSYPSSMQVSNGCLIMLSDASRQRRAALRTRWRRLAPRPGCGRSGARGDSFWQ
jgi:hypothetical protein